MMPQCSMRHHNGSRYNQVPIHPALARVRTCTAIVATANTGARRGQGKHGLVCLKGDPRRYVARFHYSGEECALAWSPARRTPAVDAAPDGAPYGLVGGAGALELGNGRHGVFSCVRLAMRMCAVAGGEMDLRGAERLGAVDVRAKTQGLSLAQGFLGGEVRYSKPAPPSLKAAVLGLGGRSKTWPALLQPTVARLSA